MAIDDLRKRIFQKDESFSRRYEEPHLGKHKNNAPVAWHSEEELEPEPTPEISHERKTARKILWWGLGGGFAVIIGLAVYFLLPGNFGSGNESIKHVSLTVEGGENVSAGKKVTWKVDYRNDNPIRLEDVSLTFEFPETSQPLVGEFSKAGIKREKRDLGMLAPGTQGEELFSAIVFGTKDASLPGKVTLEYRPEGSSARLSKEIDYASHVTATLLGVSIEMPNNPQAGQAIDIKYHVVSSAETVFKGLSLQVTYPDAFEFVSADPPASRANNIWHIGDLAPDIKYIVTVHGKIKQFADAQTFRADAGLYDRIENRLVASFTSASEALTVAPALLSLSFVTEDSEIAPGIIVAGKLLTVFVNWKNNLSVAVRNINIEVVLNGAALDFKTILSDGEVQSNSNTIRWLAARIPKLSSVDPGAGGQFSFKISTLKDIPQRAYTDKNFTVRVTGSITSVEGAAGYEGVDISGKAEKEYKVASRVLFSQKGYYYDSRIKNSGPLPPRVGQETTYTIIWSLLNTFNDIEGTEVRATIPSYLRWTGTIVPQDSSLSFNESTRELVWRPDAIAAGTGFIRPAREVAFQVGLTPSLAQIGDSPQLVSPARMEAQDTFTKTTVPSQTVKEIVTSIPDDSRAARQGRIEQ
jgi:hypothetical protein